MRLKRFQRISLGIIIFFSLSAISYAGTVPDIDHGSLEGKRIFLDPGHGGTAANDPLRTGPDGITEEAVNLQVGLLLRDSLVQAGASVTMSRTTDSDVPLMERVRAAVESQPDILVSIHHNAAVSEDVTNYPCVFFWGSDTVNPASFDLAKHLLSEFENLIGAQGRVLSDFSVYPETGTLILRETRYLCPGVIGEAGFITDPEHAKRLMDQTYLQAEAEGYVHALSRYFQRGCPTALARFSCRVDREAPAKNLIREAHPAIMVELKSGTDLKGIDLSSLSLSLDGIPVTFEKLSGQEVRVCYGKRIYPGTHRLKFQFRNSNNQSSMVYTLPFSLEIHKGDLEALTQAGRNLMRKNSSREEGLKMLSAALSINPTGPEADSLLYELSEGFRRYGDKVQSQYYLERLYYFYPQSSLRGKIERSIRTRRGYHFPAEFFGKEVMIMDAGKVGVPSE